MSVSLGNINGCSVRTICGIIGLANAQDLPSLEEITNPTKSISSSTTSSTTTSTTSTTSSLNQDIENLLPEGFSFKKPGAFHKARWMAPLLYGVKMFMFRSQLRKTKAEKIKLGRFVVFVCFYYIQYWIGAPIASDAPYNDLKFFENIIEFHAHDKDIAEIVLEKFLRHTWYLNDEYVPLSLFSDKVDDHEKAQIAKNLSKIRPKPPHEYLGGKLELVKLNPKRAYNLSDFIGSESLYMFQVLNFENTWLRKPVAEWRNYESFVEMEKFVKTLLVTNDAAERGVKLVSDFANCLTTDPKEREELLQVVEQNRRQLPDCKKSTLVKYLGQ